MTELAAGAVSSLLVVIRNEAVLLGGVRDDVQFIKEEMESMNSFLGHLARSAPQGGEHDEQVRTWMNQVRLLAQDCNNCIDLYLYSGNPEIHRAKGGHDAGDDEEEDEDDREGQFAVATPTLAHHSARWPVFEPPSLDDYVKAKLLEWIEGVPGNAIVTLSIAIVAPDADNKEVLAIAHETLVAPDYYYRRSIMVNVPAVHLDFLPLRPKEVLYYILRELEREEAAGSQKQPTDQGEWEEEDPDPWQDYYKKCGIYRSKKGVLDKIKRNIKKMNIYEKLDKIKSDIREGQHKSGKLLLLKLQEKGADQVDLHVLLQLLVLQSQQDQAKNKAVDTHKLPEWNDNLIEKLAMRLKDHMEADEKTKKLNEQTGVEEETAVRQGGGGERKEDEKDERGDGEEEGKEERRDMEKGEERKGSSRRSRRKKGGRRNRTSNDDDDDEEEEEEDDDDEEEPIHLHEDQYEQILREVFTKNASSKAQEQDKLVAEQATKTAATTLDEERIKQMINEAKQDVLRELRGRETDKNQATGEPDVPPDKNQATGQHAVVLDQNEEAYFEEVEQKIEEIKQELKEQLKIKWIVDKIKHHLQDQCPLIILKFDQMMDGSRWEEIRKALSLLELSADALIFTTGSTEQAKGYCYPPREPIDHCSLVGLYYYTVLKLTSKHKNEDNDNAQIFRGILEECEGHEFCMKIFTHAVYANPKRSNEELRKLHSTLQSPKKSFDTIAKKMFMYSYNDLPKEYKSCLLYLAIFPKGQKIRRSTLIARWVAEGLTFKEDWPSSVYQANRCFDALIRRWLVYPDDISATGKIKSCVVGDPVHGFITAIARKQHIVETRLSHHLARHFSIFNDLRLRSSDRIGTFFQGLSRSSRVSLLKVLDLEGCQCFASKNQRYLKDICNKMLLLKYLSLKGTDITQLPSEINCLRELEVLDIRETKVPANATVNVLLLKLKRLLAGASQIDPTPRNFVTNVRIPSRIDKMINIEVLSNVKAQHHDNLEDIGKLCQLRKLGVVIDGKKSHLGSLLKAISDLHASLRSLSITIPTTTLEVTPSSPELQDIASRLKHHPEFLESLSISGAKHLFPLLTEGGNKKLAKVTLSNTPLNQDDLKFFAQLPMLQCVRLRHISCTESVLNFKKDDFKCLKYLLIEGSNLTNITFEDEAACELEKMVLSSTCIESISGVHGLPKFEELELNSSSCGRLLSSCFYNVERIAKLTLRGTLLKQGDLRIIARELNICCLVLLENSFDISQNQITFEKEEFIWLKLLSVDCSTITKINFITGSAPRLKKIVWSSFTSLSGINNLPRLKELEFNGYSVPNDVEEAIKNNKSINLKHNKP
ncbi:hypothetical protein OsJ_34450 [Oryza sativa Japonica Group]|uniref:Uncharacterized protein n=1 Tax=Oryza sativa subsp. japonica TaxID=39947 RepID=A3CCU7_ORYSJ|nr:hypothetical protein OsJ_34450 [Oryza sativa Japonica Group]